MKVLIHETPDSSGSNYQVFAELVAYPTYSHLKFTSCMSDDPESTKSHFETFLSADESKKLASLMLSVTGGSN